MIILQKLIKMIVLNFKKNQNFKITKIKNFMTRKIFSFRIKNFKMRKNFKI